MSSLFKIAAPLSIALAIAVPSITHAQPEAEPIEAAGKAERVIASWSGNGIKTTEPFTIKAKKWRIEHSNTGGGILQIMVYKGSRLVTLAANAQEAGSDKSWVYQKGEFHLMINSGNTDWDVKVVAAQ